MLLIDFLPRIPLNGAFLPRIPVKDGRFTIYKEKVDLLSLKNTDLIDLRYFEV